MNLEITFIGRTFFQLSILIFILAPIHVHSAERPYYVPKVETHLINSRYIDQTFEIRVMRPLSSKEKTERLPVLYTTDGNLYFDAFRSISYQLPVTPFILVGIGYPPGDNLLGATSLRARDLLWDQYADLPEEIYKLLANMPIEGIQSSIKRKGAENFIQFIRHELIPLIDSTYATIPGERGYFGHSAGGGFGLHTLFSEEALFNRLIISSPGISFDGDDFALRQASEFIAKGKTVKVKVFMSVGLEEEFEPGLTQKWSLVSNYYRMAQLLRGAKIPGFEFVTKVFPSETHSTVPYVAFSHGVRALYPLPNLVDKSNNKDQ